jgi:poly-gamma-glutamate capsule biosynthesis protein CapA/YwtB (metallophosphatase superfamily)
MSSDGFRVALTGDSLITRGLAHNRDEPTRAMYDLIRSSDVGFTNLETVPNNFVGYPVAEAGGTHLGAHEWVLDELSLGGFNLLAAANNHSLNYGVTGLLELISILNRRNIRFSGIGANLAESRAPAYLDTDAGSVALISCASTFAPGHEASEQRPDVQGRPGLNPLRYSTVYSVPEEILQTLRTLAQELGLERKRLERIAMGFGFPPDDPDVFPFLGESFKAGNRTETTTAPDQGDLDAIASWVPEAKARADIVVVSFHAHEDGGDKETPAEFLQTFAHRMVDEGADVVVGHGPHLLRGMEMYKGVPIFYSLGNFIGQNDLTFKLPSDSYRIFRVDRDEHAGQIFHQRSDGGKRGFPADVRFWQTIMPICIWRDGKLATIDVYPITLRLDPKPALRGRPALADGDEAESILDRFRQLSDELGSEWNTDTRIRFVE